jgi:hypothetical protein
MKLRALRLRAIQDERGHDSAAVSLRSFDRARTPDLGLALFLLAWNVWFLVRCAVSLGVYSGSAGYESLLILIVLIGCIVRGLTNPPLFLRHGSGNHFRIWYFFAISWAIVTIVHSIIKHDSPMQFIFREGLLWLIPICALIGHREGDWILIERSLFIQLMIAFILLLSGLYQFKDWLGY